MLESPFSLVKWYMDCVSGDGDAAILYCARVCWLGLRLAYSSVLQVDHGSTRSHTSLAQYRLSSTSGRIDVEFPRLKVSGKWEAQAAPFERTVYENSSGAVVWNCLQPRSSVHLRIGNRELTGLGYAECLTLTLPPWLLPMRRLRWGRFVSPHDCLAWVDWQGPYATSFALCNGLLCETLSVSDTEVALPCARLRMEESLALRAGRLGSTVLPGAPALGKLLPRALFNIHEQKWRSYGTLKANQRSSQGWVIHEVVDWKL